jgi:hypothetical protein
MKRVLFTIALCLAVATSATAQVQSGTIAGTVVDEQGGVLPGVTVTLTGADRTATFVSDGTGKFRFLNLPPGTYRVEAELSGFTTLIRDHIVVAVGQTVDLPMTLRVASVAETVTVSGESPIVDTKAMGTATNFSQSELEMIPTSRDPWALLRTVPGVTVDRVNIAGNETGQQSNFQSKGTRSVDAVWTMDGVVITDMAAIGSSPTYFNYDNFEEIQISTSGQDIRQPTGGVGLNFVVKRGTNQLKGGVRGFFTSDALEATNLPTELADLGVTPETADHIGQISDYGFELGGPIVKDKAWVYGSWSDQDIRLFRKSSGAIDRTVLKTINVKGSWQATSKDLVSVLWFLGAKEKYGRSPGLSGITTDAATATWDQGGAYTKGAPKGLWKLEDNHIFGSNLFVTGRYAYYNTGFGLAPEGGLDMPAGEDYILGQTFGSTRDVKYLRPQHSASVDSNLFVNGYGGGHDLKFGGGWRRADAASITQWPTDMIRAMANSVTDYRARLYRGGSGTNRLEFFNLYVSDTFTRDRATLDVGVRYDRQWGSALASQTTSNIAFPNLVPGIDFAGYRAPFTWNTVSPRIGFTYALDDARKTVLRTSFNRYAGQLETGIVGFMNPSANSGYVDYPWVDANGDHFAQPDEVLVNEAPISFGGGFDPANPTSVESADQIDPNLKPSITTSFVAGIDRELIPNLAVQVNYSYTRTTDNNENFTYFYAPWVGVTAADYLPGTAVTGTLPDGMTYDIPTYIPDPDVVAANGNATILTNWPGYTSYYHGMEVSLVKRLSNRWMARVGFSLNQARETYGDHPVNDAGNPTRVDTSPLVNGGQYVTRSGGSGTGDIFMSAKWQLSANGVYQFPRDIEVGASLFGRQGYPFPVYRNASLGLDGSRRVLVTPAIDTFRFANLWDLDLRVAKTVRLERLNLQVMADLFNVFNSNTELVRNRNAASPNFRELAANLSPRIVRFGVRVNF